MIINKEQMSKVIKYVKSKYVNGSVEDSFIYFTEVLDKFRHGLAVEYRNKRPQCIYVY